MATLGLQSFNLGLGTSSNLNTKWVEETQFRMLLNQYLGHLDNASNQEITLKSYVYFKSSHSNPCDIFDN